MTAKQKLIASGVGIVILVLALIVVFISNLRGPVDEDEIPTAPSMPQLEMEKYIKTSTKSWADNALLCGENPEDIKAIYFVYERPDGLIAQSAWVFDGIQCYCSDGYLYVEVGYGVRILGSMNGAFANMTNVTEIQGIGALQTENVADMSNLFKNCSSIEQIQIKGLETNNLVLSSSMFEGCTSLQTLDMSDMDFTTVVDIDYMFAHCNSLKTLQLPETRDITTARYLFYDVGTSVSEKTQLIGSINTSNCKYMDGMFQMSRFFNYNIAENFDTKNLISAFEMFKAAGELYEINLSNWDTKSLQTTERMFFDCTALLSCNINNWDVTNLNNCNEMFALCSRLSQLEIGWINLNTLRSAQNMFSTCISIKELDFSAFNNSHIGDARKMFFDCNDIESIMCTGFTADVSDEMFKYCRNLPNYKEGQWYADMAIAGKYFKAKE